MTTYFVLLLKKFTSSLFKFLILPLMIYKVLSGDNWTIISFLGVNKIILIELFTVGEIPSDAPLPLDIQQIENGPLVVQPIRVEPLVVQPIRVEPLVVQPIRVEPLVVQPIKVKLPVVQPIRVEPLVTKPIRAEPLVVQPISVEQDHVRIPKPVGEPPWVKKDSPEKPEVSYKQAWETIGKFEDLLIRQM